MTQNKTLAVLILILLLASTILTACQSPLSTQQLQSTVQTSVDQTMTSMPTATNTPAPTSTSTPTATATQVPVQYGPKDFPANVDPLTGLTVSDPSILNRRPVLVKVSNFPRSARPHAGLSFADIVFSYSIGEGANRYLALFYGQNATQVGSVRSGRYIDRWLVYMYQGILGFVSAWLPELNAIYGQLGDRAISYGPNNPAFYSIGPDDPNNADYVNRVMVDTQKLSNYYASLAGANNSKPNLDGTAFATIPPSGGTAGTELTFDYTSSNIENWRYDPTTKKYFRWIDSEDAQGNVSLIPLVDRDTGKQLSFSNVIVMWAHYQTLNHIDSMHEVSLVGTGGTMMLFRDGQMYEGKWKGSKTDGPIRFYDQNNQPLQLQPGNTWITITGDISTSSQDNPGQWSVKFVTEPYGS